MKRIIIRDLNTFCLSPCNPIIEKEQPIQFNKPDPLYVKNTVYLRLRDLTLGSLFFFFYKNRLTSLSNSLLFEITEKLPLIWIIIIIPQLCLYLTFKGYSSSLIMVSILIYSLILLRIFSQTFKISRRNICKNIVNWIGKCKNFVKFVINC